MHRLSNRVYAALIFISASAQVGAQQYPPDSDLVYPVEEMYASCGDCHGAQGQGVGGDQPAIAGQPAWYIERQLNNFMDRIRGNHPDDLTGIQMQILTGMVRNDATIKALSAYIESMEPGAGETPEPQQRQYIWESTYGALDAPEPGDIEKGKATYTSSCIACHGADAQGVEALGGNMLTNLSAEYLSRQLKYFKSGVRGADPRDTKGQLMATSSQVLADEQAIADVIAYIETLTPPRKEGSLQKVVSKPVEAVEIPDLSNITLAELKLKAPLEEDRGWCLDLFGRWDMADTLIGFHSHTCLTYAFDEIKEDQGFDVDRLKENNELHVVVYDKCVTMLQPGPGSYVGAEDCNGEASQQLSMDADGRIISLDMPELCLTIGEWPIPASGGDPLHLVRGVSFETCDESIGERQAWEFRTEWTGPDEATTLERRFPVNPDYTRPEH